MFHEIVKQINKDNAKQIINYYIKYQQGINNKTQKNLFMRMMKFNLIPKKDFKMNENMLILKQRALRGYARSYICMM